MTLNYVDAQKLVQLTNTKATQAAAQYGAVVLTSDAALQAAIAAQLAEQEKNANEEAASEILFLLGNKDEFLLNNATTLINLQAQIDSLNALQAKVQLTTQYGLATSNFLPLLKMLGGAIPAGVDKASTEVPKEWSAPQVQPTAAPVANTGSGS